MDSDDDDASAVPGYKNYLIYTDESGMHRGPYYGFGSLWLPWERRGEMAEQLRGLREKHRHFTEIKWKNVTRKTAPFYHDLVEWFFRRRWLMFHCVIVRRATVNHALHKDRDQAQQKHFCMLLRNKIALFGRDGGKRYRLRVDPLPWRYPKAGEVVEKIVNAELQRDIGVAAVHDLIARDSKLTPGIQISDLLLGSVLAAWQEQAEAAHKLDMMSWCAEHLGWPSLRHDTQPTEWKFNVWHFHDPTSGGSRHARTRPVCLKHPMPSYARRSPRR